MYLINLLIGEDAQKHFKSLREKYIRIKRDNERNQRSGAGAPIVTDKWYLFDLMKFLDEIIKPRKTASSLTSPSCSSAAVLEVQETMEDTQPDIEAVFVEIDHNYSDRELDRNILSPASASNTQEIENILLTPSTSSKRTMQTPTLGEKKGTPLGGNKRKLEEKFSSTLDMLQNNSCETKSDTYINTFCANMEQEMLKMPSNIMEDFKDEVTTLLLKTRRKIRKVTLPADDM
ncbi:uncharacterized protein LOC116173470 [Photinus pyralis]|uniref:uncharacterized protein LOC116173470 n=1 Tax=Photinus pyralis TaxID=7054 RepID=UPI0012670BDB|nr:uncharacterized protein LOC116173470 [Photinus pyralis]